MNKVITIKTLCIVALFNFEHWGSWGPLDSYGPQSGASAAPPLVRPEQECNLTLLLMVVPGSPPDVCGPSHFCQDYLNNT